MRYVVNKDEEGLRLQLFLHKRLSKQEECSLRQVKRWLDEKRCRINGQVEAFCKYQVRYGDRVEFLSAKGDSDYADILFDDDSLVAYNKPAGLCYEDVAPQHEAVHRLDKETSGVLLFAKSIPMREELDKLFAERQIFKRYLAVVAGEPRKESFAIENYLGVVERRGDISRFGAVDAARGRFARTVFNVLESRGGRSLIACMPETGRTHQIRVHLASVGCPVWGDTLYGSRKNCAGTLRHLLHAHRLVFDHPATGEKIRLEAPTPKEFRL